MSYRWLPSGANRSTSPSAWGSGRVVHRLIRFLARAGSLPVAFDLRGLVGLPCFSAPSQDSASRPFLPLPWSSCQVEQAPK